MGPVVVALDVAADPSPGVVERLVLVQPHLPLFEFPEPALNEGLRLGVAVAAATMADPELGEPSPEATGGEGRPVVAAEYELAGLDAVRDGGAVDEGDSLPRRGSAG